MDIKEALVQSSGNIDSAIEFLRKRGQLLAAKKEGRKTTQGFIAHYIHGNGRIAALVEVNCETDFVARNPEFQNFAKELAMQVVARDPRYISPEDISEPELSKEKEILTEQTKNENKPEELIEKILQGKLQKFFDEACLIRQPYFRNEKKTIRDLIAEVIGKMGENIQIRRFIRFSL